MPGFFYIVFQASSYSQVLLTSTDLSQQFSAPFKAGNSRQAQTCNISQEYNTKKTQCQTGSNSFRTNGRSRDLEPQSVDITMFAA